MVGFIFKKKSCVNFLLNVDLTYFLCSHQSGAISSGHCLTEILFVICLIDKQQIGIMIEIFQQIQEESQGLVHCPSNQLYKNPMEYFQTFYKVSTFLEGHMIVM